MENEVVSGCLVGRQDFTDDCRFNEERGYLR